MIFDLTDYSLSTGQDTICIHCRHCLEFIDDPATSRTLNLGPIERVTIASTIAHAINHHNEHHGDDA